ncbi:MAG: DNA-directed RNA polymerase subunit P [Thermofilum sp.]|nr:DNA-directed RNA polymerase subunit P [Thermofilum sp.]
MSEPMSFSSEDEKVYRCLRCGSVFSKKEQEILPGFRCPHCGFKIVEKVRPAVPKRVRAL